MKIKSIMTHNYIGYDHLLMRADSPVEKSNMVSFKKVVDGIIVQIKRDKEKNILIPWTAIKAIELEAGKEK